MRFFDAKLNTLSFGVILFILITIHNNSKYGASLSWMLPACSIIFMGYLIQNYSRTKSTPVALFVFWLTTFLSTALSSVVPLEHDIFTFAFFLISYYLVSRISFGTQHIKLFIYVYILSALIVSIFIIKNWIIGDFYIAWTLRSSYKFFGEYKDPNYVTAYTVPVAFFTFLKILYTDKLIQKQILFTLLLIHIIAILCTGSRAAILALTLSIGFFYLFDNTMSIKKKIIIAFVASIIIYSLFTIYITIMPEQVFDRFNSSSEDSRLQLWAAGMIAFSQNPIWGSGLNSSSYFSNMYIGNYSHNVYIDIIGSSGLIGALCLLYVFANNCLKTKSYNQKFIYSTFIAFFLPLTFINGFNTATFLMPLMLMTILSHYCKTAGNHFQDLFNNGHTT